MDNVVPNESLFVLFSPTPWMAAKQPKGLGSPHFQAKWMEGQKRGSQKNNTETQLPVV